MKSQVSGGHLEKTKMVMGVGFSGPMEGLPGKNGGRKGQGLMG